MQARHIDRKRYFDDSAITSARFYLPYISRFHTVEKDSRILEVGCGEGGNLKPFAQMGCVVHGIDMAQVRIRQARAFFAAEGLEGNFACADFLGNAAPKREEERFDVILLHDVIEHVPGKEAFLRHLCGFMKAGGVLFVAFPAWHMPFGGHQQICRNKIWSQLPFYHLLPRSWYRLILKRWAGEEDATVRELMYIRECRCSVELFQKIVASVGLAVLHRQLWLVNPHYEQKFGLRPVRLHGAVARIPFLRDLFATSCFYVLQGQPLD